MEQAGGAGDVSPQKLKRNNCGPPKFYMKLFSNIRKYMSLVYVEQLEMVQLSLKDMVNLNYIQPNK